jgi:hypothetical protein
MFGLQVENQGHSTVPNSYGIYVDAQSGSSTASYSIYTNGGLHRLGGGVIFPYVAKTADYVLTINDYTVNCTANSFNITLPTAVNVAGLVYNIKNSGTGVITLLTTSSQTIDGNASGALTLNQYENLTVQSDGANWMII